MGTLASGSIDLKSLKVAGEPNKYITYIDSNNGIRVYDGASSNKNVNFTQINSNGLQIYRGGTNAENKIADFGETITIGKEATDIFNIKITNQAISNYGPGILLRKGNVILNEITSEGMNLYDNNSLLLKVTNSQLEYARTNTTTNILSIQRNDDSKYYLSTDPSLYSIVARYVFYTANETKTISTLEDVENNTHFIVITSYYSKSSNIDWEYTDTRCVEFVKGVAKTEIGFGINDAILNIEYDGNITFNFNVTNSENTQIGYGPDINAVTITSGSSYGHIGSWTAYSTRMNIRGDNSFSFNGGQALGNYAFAINSGKALGPYSFACGTSTTVTGNGSAVFGSSNAVFGGHSFAVGYNSLVFKHFGIAMGEGLHVTRHHQTVLGQYNAEDSQGLFIIGNGTDHSHRSNAFVLDSEGNLKINNGFRIINDTGYNTRYYADSFGIYLQDDSIFNIQADTTNKQVFIESAMSTFMTGKSVYSQDFVEALAWHLNNEFYVGLTDQKIYDKNNNFTGMTIQNALSASDAIVTKVLGTNGLDIHFDEEVFGNEFESRSLYCVGTSTRYFFLIEQHSTDVFQSIFDYLSNNCYLSDTVSDGKIHFLSGDNQTTGFYLLQDELETIGYSLTWDSMINPNKTYYTRFGTNYTSVSSPILAELFNGQYYERIYPKVWWGNELECTVYNMLKETTICRRNSETYGKMVAIIVYDSSKAQNSIYITNDFFLETELVTVNPTYSSIQDYTTASYNSISSDGMSLAYDSNITHSSGSSSIIRMGGVKIKLAEETVHIDGNIEINGEIASHFLIGQIIMYAGTILPKGWLYCDGSAVSRTTYAALFNIIGTTYGAGDGSTTFNLPNFRGRMPIGVGQSSATGATNHTLAQMNGSEDAIIPYHNHSVSAGGSHSHGASTANYYYHISSTNEGADEGSAISGSGYKFPRTSASATWVRTQSTGAANVPAHNTNYAGTNGNTTGANMPPYLGINFIIHVGIPTV